jgi:hypothetical protein
MRLPSAVGVLAGSSSMAEGARIERAWDARPQPRFSKPVLLPLSQPSIEARDGVEPSIDSGFAGRHPPGENRARVPQEGVEPSRPETHGSEPCAAAITPPGHGVDDGDRTRGLLLGKQMRYQLRHVHMEPARRIELRLPPYRGGVLPFSLNRHGWNRVRAWPAADYLTLQREPPSGAAPDLRLYRSRAAAARGGNVPSARFERALPGTSCQCLLPLGYEGPEPPPGADPGHPLYESGAAAVRGGEAARRGFEPRPSAPRTRCPAS